MSDDWDFEMEVVEDGELGSTASPSEGSIKPDDAANDDRSSTELVESKEEASSRFEGLPEAWAVHKLQEAAKVVGGSTPSTNNDEYWGGDMPWATPTDVTGLRGTTITETEDKITEEGLNSASTHILPEYSVLMTSRATIGACAVNTVPMATNQGFQSLVPGERLNTWYLFYRMLNEAPYLESLGAGSTFSEVSKRVVEKIDIPVPPLPEQRKIASVLYAVDQAIQKTEAITEQAKRVKRGLMQDLWAYGLDGIRESVNSRESSRAVQETTVGQFPKDWKIVNLDSVTERVTDGTHQAVETLPDGEEGIPFLYVSCIRDGQINWEKASSVSEEVYKEISEGKEPEAGVILYTAVGSYGHAVMLKGDKGLGFQRHIAYIRPDELAIHPKFLTHWLDSVRAKKYADRVAQGNAQKTVTLYDLSNYPVPLPSREIQEEIADFLDQFDSRVQSEEGIKEKLKRLKKGLMQDLLTGEVRTMDKAIEVLGEVNAHG